MPFDVVVRTAQRTDLDGICEVAEAVQLASPDAQHDGFLVYVHDREGYADLMAATNLFYVALDGKDVVGFIVCYDDRSVADLVARGVLKDDVLRASVVAGCKGRWIYGDQIAVLPSHVHRGIGHALVLKLYDLVHDWGIDSVFVGVLHEPLNAASKSFCEGLGFVHQGSLRYQDGRLWDIYRYGLG